MDHVGGDKTSNTILGPDYLGLIPLDDYKEGKCHEQLL